MSGRDELLEMAKNHDRWGLKALERGELGAAEAAEHADVARLLRQGAAAIRDYSPAEQQDYANRFKAALSLRQGDVMDTEPVEEAP